MNTTNTTVEMYEIGGIIYLHKHSGLYVPYMILYILGVIFGFFGNILIMGAIILTKELHNTTNMLVFNLALADITISGLVDSSTIIGIFFGQKLFLNTKGLCDAIAAICLIACTTSMMSIGVLAVNRYIHICHNNKYSKIFTIPNTLIFCLITWLIGISVDMPLFFGWSRHTYDLDTLSCIWDRRGSRSFTLFFPITIIIIPCCWIIFCYIKVFLFVRKSKRKINALNNNVSNSKTIKDRNQSINFAKGLFGSFIIFTICWVPYGLVVMTDWYYTYPPAASIYTVVLAHLNSAFNPILYGSYNSKYRTGYKKVIELIFCVKLCNHHQSTASSNLTNTTSMKIGKRHAC